MTSSALSSSNSAAVVDIPGQWHLVLDYTNDTDNPVDVSATWIKGFKSTEQKTNRVKATHSIGRTITAGMEFELISLSSTLEYNFTHETETVSMNQEEIEQRRELNVKAKVSPHTRLIRWQLVADVAGSEVGFDKIVDSKDPKYIDGIGKQTKATVIIAREIEPGSTKLRIKHKQRGKYMAVISRKNWPAATLSHDNNYYFKIHRASGNQYRIETLNTTHPGYRFMYSSDQGGVYFDTQDDNDKQLWTLSRSFPLRDGDIVTVRNVYWPASYLCYHDGPATSVYCLHDQEEE